MAFKKQGLTAVEAFGIAILASLIVLGVSGFLVMVASAILHQVIGLEALSFAQSFGVALAVRIALFAFRGFG